MKAPYELLVVDDVPENLKLISGLLKELGYQYRLHQTAEAAYQSAVKRPPDLMLLDINLPDYSGILLCKKLRKIDPLRDIPIIFLSAMHNQEVITEGFAAGGNDYITKPYHLEEVKARLEAQLNSYAYRQLLAKKNEELSQEVVKKEAQLIDMQLAALKGLVQLADARDDDTGAHIRKIQYFCKALANFAQALYPAFRIDEAFKDQIFYASALHDIGKVAISDRILLKPGPLNEEEHLEMQEHVVIGANVLENIRLLHEENPYIKMGIDITRYHHEHWDGSGYVAGLVGDQIPLSARIMTICDVYDALRSTRVYKSAYDHEKSIRIMKEYDGTYFDPRLFKVFMDHEEDFNNLYERIVGDENEKTSG